MVHPHNIPRIQPGTHPEDAQPSESAPSNRRISFPPQVLPAHQPGRAGGWANAGQSRPQAQGRGNGLFIPQRGGGGLGRGGARGGGGYRPPRGRGGGANAPYIIPPRNNRGEKSTVAGGWASSALFAPLPARPDDSTVASRSGGKGKGREVEGAPERPSSTNGGYADYFSQKQQQQQYQQPATPIAVPQNPRATLFVKGFYGASTEEDVRAIFAPYGPVTNVGRSQHEHFPDKPFFFVTCSSPACAERALRNLQGEPVPLPSSTASSSVASTSSSVQQRRELYIEFHDAKRNSSSAAIHQPNTGLFNRETPAPSISSASAAAAKYEASPAASLSTASSFSRTDNLLHYLDPDDAPTLIYDSHTLPPLSVEQRKASHSNFQYIQNRFSCPPHRIGVLDVLYALPPSLEPMSTHSGLTKAVYEDVRAERYGERLSVFKHGFEGDKMRMWFAPKVPLTQPPYEAPTEPRKSKKERRKQAAMEAMEAERRERKDVEGERGGDGGDGDGEMSMDESLAGSEVAGEEVDGENGDVGGGGGEEERGEHSAKEEPDEDDFEVERLLRPTLTPAPRPLTSGFSVDGTPQPPPRAASVAGPPPALSPSAPSPTLDPRRRLPSRTPAAAPPPPPPAVTEEDQHMQEEEEEEEDEALTERVLLPDDCRGTSVQAKGKKRRFLAEQVKRLVAEGKVVVDNSVDGEFLLLDYLLDESFAPEASPPLASTSAAVVAIPAAAPPSPPQPFLPSPNTATPASTSTSSQVTSPAAAVSAVRPPLSARTTTTSAVQEGLAQLHLPPPVPVVPNPAALAAPSPQQAAYDVDMEDIKPVIQPSPPPRAVAAPEQRIEVEGEEVDELEESPEPQEPARFPEAMHMGSKASDADTGTIARAFIIEYFRRFDQSRASLEPMYTNNATFSLKLDKSVTPRAMSSPPLFSRTWLDSASRELSITPIAITNAIRSLPAGSTDVEKIIFRATSLPELVADIGPTGHTGRRHLPIHLHVVGEFEEFADKVVRRFSRTFLLLPKNTRGAPGTQATSVGLEYWIRCDQLTVQYMVENEPRSLPVQSVPFKRLPKQKPVIARVPVVRTASRQQAPPFVVPMTSTSAGAQIQSHGGAARSPPAQPVQQTQQHPAPAPVASTSRAGPPPAAPAVAAPAAPPSPPRGRVPWAAQQDPAPSPERRPVASTSAAAVPDCIVLSDSDSDDGDASMSSSRDDFTNPRPAETISHSPELARRPAPAPAPAPPRSAAAFPIPVPNPSAIDKLVKKRRAESDLDGSSTPAAKKKAAQRIRTAATAAAVEQAEAGPSANANADGSTATLSAGVLAEVERVVQAALAKAGVGGMGTGSSEVGGGKAPSSATSSSTTTGAAAGKKVEVGKKTKEKGKEKEKGKGKAKELELGMGLGSTDRRIVILTSTGTPEPHGFDGKSNKLRHMVATSPSTFLAASFIGDITEFSLSSGSSSLMTSRKPIKSTQDKFRIDDFAWSAAKETLIVGYLGTGGAMAEQPPNQVVLYRKESMPDGETVLHEGPVEHHPHTKGGVSAVAVVPGGGRLRWATGGEDKKIFLWTRQRSTQATSSENVRTGHTSTITSLMHAAKKDWIVSSGKDKRVIAHDLSHNSPAWQSLLSHPVMTVQPLPFDPNLILARLGSPSNQFVIHDLRLAGTAAPTISFGIDLPPHRHATNGTLSETNMSRYLRGDVMDTVFAFPDPDLGVKLWDLRQVRVASSQSSSASTPLDASILKSQNLQSLSRSKVVQTMFAGRNELCLLGISHFTRVQIRG